jgi:hypothetical protein
MLARILLIVVLGLAATFVALNWNALNIPGPLDVGFTTINAPLGLAMLAITAAVTVAFLVFIVYLQTVVLLDLRRAARELRAQRELAEQAEASRLADLRTFITAELVRMRTALESTENAIAADIGELRQRLGEPDK